MTELGLDLEKVGWLILKARELDGGPEPGNEDHGSGNEDHHMPDLTEADEDDPTLHELRTFIDGLNDDEQVRLVALAWIGRGDYTGRDWREAIATARGRRTTRTSRYLLGMPLLSDYLDEGLAAFATAQATR